MLLIFLFLEIHYQFEALKVFSWVLRYLECNFSIISESSLNPSAKQAS